MPAGSLRWVPRPPGPCCALTGRVHRDGTARARPQGLDHLWDSCDLLTSSVVAAGVQLRRVLKISMCTMFSGFAGLQAYMRGAGVPVVLISVLLGAVTLHLLRVSMRR